MKGMNNKGFTLIEMLIVVTIIAILAIMIIQRIQLTKEQAVKAAHAQIRQELNAGLQRWYFDNGTYVDDATANSYLFLDIYYNSIDSQFIAGEFPDIYGVCQYGTPILTTIVGNHEIFDMAGHEGHE